MNHLDLTQDDIIEVINKVQLKQKQMREEKKEKKKKEYSTREHE
jgi:hypothetical protein